MMALRLAYLVNKAAAAMEAVRVSSASLEALRVSGNALEVV